MNERKELEQAIVAQEALRGTLPDAVVDATLVALREKLAALDDALVSKDEQRKLVTILVADLAGWTAMSEHMDPEDVAGVQRAYFDTVTPPIIEQGGRVEKYIGDAVLAVFGVPQAHEDDPERAIRAALGMQKALERSNVPTFQGSNVLRIGIHTGLVLATLGERVEDFVVTGDTVNLASRLESAAPPGGVLIARDTYRHVRGLFEVEALEPLALKGKAEPIQAYLVQGIRPRSFHTVARGIEGVETPMVGRQAELLMLQNLFRDALEDGDTRIVTLAGDAGVGKSRLLYEFERWIDRQPGRLVRWRGRANSGTEHQPYGLLRDLLASQFGVLEDDSMAVVRRKLEEGMADLNMRQEVDHAQGSSPATHHLPSPPAPLIGQLVGFDFSDSPLVRELLDDPRLLRDRAVAHLVEYSRRTTQRSPVLLLLEDIHWADDSSLDVLDHLVSQLRSDRGAPLLVIGLARPSLFSRRPHWGEGLDYHTRIDLRALSRLDSRRLLAEILQKVEEVPESLRDLLVAGAEGNPYALEELTRTLIEDQVIVKGGDHWRVDRWRLTQVQVPPTLAAVLQARLDRLSPEERVVLQQASVVGRAFWDSVIEYLRVKYQVPGVKLGSDRPRPGAETLDTVQTPEPSQGLDTVLDSLRSREMVFQREASTFVDTSEYVFRHSLLREVTYESVLKRLRQVYHGLVADWLVERSGERIGEHAGLVADHMELAGRTDEAFRYLVRASERAAGVYAHQEAADLYGRAIAIAGRQDQPGQDLATLYVARGRMLEHAGRFADAIDGYREMETVAQARRDRAMECAAVGRLVACYIEPSDVHNLELADALIDRGLRLARELGDDEQEAHLLWCRMMRATHYGNPEEAQAAGEACIAIAREYGLDRQLATTLHDLALNLRLSGQVETGQAYAQEARALFRQQENLPLLVDNLNQQALIDYLHLHLQAAMQHASEAAQISQRIDNLWNLAYSSWVRAMVQEALGQWGQAQEDWRDSMAWGKQAGFLMSLTIVPMQLGALLRELGQLEEARSLHDEAHAAAEELAPFLLRAAEAQLALDGLAAGDAPTGQRWMKSSLAREPLGEIGTALALSDSIQPVVDWAEQSGAWSQALAEVEDAVSDARHRRLLIHEVRLNVARGRCLLGLGRLSEAAQLLEEVLETAREAPLLPERWRVHRLLARVYLGLDQASVAGTHRQQATQIGAKLVQSLADPSQQSDFLSHRAVPGD